jgi:phage-related protein
MKQVIWMGSSREDLRAFPREARRDIGYQLEHVQEENQSAGFGLGRETI